MKNYFKYFLIIGFVLFSFYYTDKVTKISEQNNVIMASINDYAIKHDSKCIEGSITEDGIILGLSGISVNKNKSYSNMKGIGFDEKLLEYNKEECILSTNNKTCFLLSSHMSIIELIRARAEFKFCFVFTSSIAICS